MPVSVPLPLRLSVPLETTTVPLLLNAGATWMAVPESCSSVPEFKIDPLPVMPW